MKRIVVVSFLVVAALVATLLVLFKADPRHAIVREAYIYGYPLVTMDMTRRQLTNVAVADEAHGPMGQLIKMRGFPAVENHVAAAPNAETLYTMVWYDLSSGPWVFSIPDMGARFYIMPMLSGFNEVFFVAGSRATGQGAQTYAITGPGWSGQLPDGVTEVKSPTALVWVLGRVYCTGTPEDYAAVHDLQDRFRSVPLSAYRDASWVPPAGTVDASFDMTRGVRDQVNAMPLQEYFAYLARLLRTNPPKPEDGPVLARMAEIGIVPGEELDPGRLPTLGKRVDPKLALLEMVRVWKDKEPVNGWLYWNTNAGSYGTDYDQRAMVTLIGPGLNFPQDAVYPFSEKDPDGNAYDGSKHEYVIRFEKGQLPPVNGFWSITMYDEAFFFVPNPINRYNLSQRDHLVENPDGSVDLYLQAESPGADKEANWLPAPKGKFIPMMRLYWPKDTPPTILDGSWRPPPIRRAR